MTVHFGQMNVLLFITRNSVRNLIVHRVRGQSYNNCNFEFRASLWVQTGFSNFFMGRPLKRKRTIIKNEFPTPLRLLPANILPIACNRTSQLVDKWFLPISRLQIVYQTSSRPMGHLFTITGYDLFESQPI